MRRKRSGLFWTGRETSPEAGTGNVLGAAVEEVQRREALMMAVGEAAELEVSMRLAEELRDMVLGRWLNVFRRVLKGDSPAQVEPSRMSARR